MALAFGAGVGCTALPGVTFRCSETAPCRRDEVCTEEGLCRAPGPRLVATPASGAIGSVVRIFDPTSALVNAVRIGGVEAVVLAAAPGETRALVMPGTLGGFVQIDAAGRTRTADTFFTVLPAALPDLTDLRLLAPPVDAGALAFGSAVALDAQAAHALVGAPGTSQGQGAAWWFELDGAQPSAHSLLPVEMTPGGRSLGASVALSADACAALVGGPAESSGRGAWWRFEVDAGVVWPQPRADFALDAGAREGLGVAVALSAAGTTSVVGSRFAAVDGGVQVTRIDERGDVSTVEWFRPAAPCSTAWGTTVAVSAEGRTVAVGARDDVAGVGCAWVFQWADDGWLLRGSELSAPGGRLRQAPALALSGDGSALVLVSSGPGGTAWVYGRDATGGWPTTGTALPLDEGATPAASVSISADGQRVALGHDDATGRVSLHVVVGEGWVRWSEAAVASPAAAPSSTSVALSLDGARVIVGRPSAKAGRGEVWLSGSPR